MLIFSAWVEGCIPKIGMSSGSWEPRHIVAGFFSKVVGIEGCRCCCRSVSFVV